MGEPKFTPGPWQAFTENMLPTPHEDTYVIYGGGSAGQPEVLLATVVAHRLTSRSDTQRANKSLIAAAPDLYEALNQAIQEYGIGLTLSGETVEQCRRALAKARGEAA